MRLSIRSAWPVLALATLLTRASSQTFSDCNPIAQSGCPPNTALGSSKSFDFSSGASNDFITTGSVTYDSNGAAFTVANQGDSPTLKSKWYIMFGHVEWVVKAAPGTGIVSSALLQSDCLDEIDWEWIGGDNAQVQSNYFGKGITNSGGNHGAFHAATNNHDQYHTYTMDWTAEQIVWQVDGVTVRAATAADALPGQYPQTPMQVRMGAWAGGDPRNPPGTINWAGGPTDYSAGPFTMYVKSIKVTDYSTGTSYSYGDQSGTWRSIQSQGGRINSQGGGTPIVDPGTAPAVTSAVSESAPLAFDPSNSASVYATRTGYPWVLDSATATAVTAILSPSPSLSPASSPASPLASGLSVRTSWDDQGLATLVTYDPATATLPVSYDGQGFTVTTSASQAPSGTATQKSPANTLASAPVNSAESITTLTPSSQPTDTPPSGPSTAPPSVASSVPPSGAPNSPSSVSSPTSPGSSGQLSSGSGTLATSTRQTTVTSAEPSQTTATSTTQETPAAPNSNIGSRGGIRMGALAVIAAILAF